MPAASDDNPRDGPIRPTRGCGAKSGNTITPTAAARIPVSAGVIVGVLVGGSADGFIVAIAAVGITGQAIPINCSAQ